MKSSSVTTIERYTLRCRFPLLYQCSCTSNLNTTWLMWRFGGPLVSNYPALSRANLFLAQDFSHGPLALCRKCVECRVGLPRNSTLGQRVTIRQQLRQLRSQAWNNRAALAPVDLAVRR